VVAPTFDGHQLRSGPDAVKDLTLGLYEWKGDVWGIMSGAGFRRGYVAGTRQGDEVTLAIAALDDNGRPHGLEAGGRVIEVGGQVALDMDWTIAPRRLVTVGWISPDGAPPPPTDQRPGPTGVARLVEVDEDNLREVIAVRPAPHQDDYVADNARSIAEAHLCDPRGWYRAVYDGDVCVGFVMLAHFDDPAHEDHARYHGWYLWRLLIGARHQRRGYGTQVIHLICRHIDAQGGPRRLTTSWHDEIGGPEPFYRTLGFEPTGEIDQGEVVAILARWPEHDRDAAEA
jgi:diamine N-acetyltransferase